MHPGGAPGCNFQITRTPTAYAEQLASVFFNLSLTQSVISTCFKQTTIVPVPTNAKVTCLNDYHLIALTSVAMKCFERLVMAHINTIIPDTPNTLQFAYRPNRYTDDVTSISLHTAISYLDKRNTYVRMLFIDYSTMLITKIRTLGLNSSLCNWILYFLSSHPQVVRVGNNTSTSLTLNTGAPQGCVLRPLLYALFTHFCVTPTPLSC
jgi:hypothetical protein